MKPRIRKCRIRGFSISATDGHLVERDRLEEASRLGRHIAPADRSERILHLVAPVLDRTGEGKVQHPVCLGARRLVRLRRSLELSAQFLDP